MNLVILKGNLGEDPEVKSFDWGKVAKFSLATTETFKNKAGEKITETEWHNIVFKGAVVDVIEKYLHKGDQIVIEGKNKTRKYDDKSGVTHWSTEVVCDSFEFCTPAKEKQPENKEGKNQKGTEMEDRIRNGEFEDKQNDELSDMPF